MLRYEVVRRDSEGRLWTYARDKGRSAGMRCGTQSEGGSARRSGLVGR